MGGLHRQGVVIHTAFDGSNDKQECLVRWDPDWLDASMSEWQPSHDSWEMGTDLRIVPNIPGDAFLSMGNGFGVRVDETCPKDAVAVVRERQAMATDSRLLLLEGTGVLPKHKQARTESRDRQLSLDIRSRITHGMPVKGGANGRQVDPRREGLAKAAALGEPMLVRKGVLRKACTLRPFQTDIGISGRIINLTRRLTKAQKRKLKQRRVGK
jgi:hypothetical protein